MIELLMMLVIPQEISPEKLGMKYILKDKFVDYQSCQKYVEENLYFRKDKNVGVFYKINTKEYQVMLTYCKPVNKQ